MYEFSSHQQHNPDPWLCGFHLFTRRETKAECNNQQLSTTSCNICCSHVYLIIYTSQKSNFITFLTLSTQILYSVIIHWGRTCSPEERRRQSASLECPPSFYTLFQQCTLPWVLWKEAINFLNYFTVSFRIITGN